MNSFQLYRDSAFLMKGIWKLMKEDWNHDWMIKSNVVWLTSDLYLYYNNAYRAAGGDFKIFHRNAYFIYIIERAQRFCSYAIVLSHVKEPEFTFFHWAVFYCILAIDIYDAWMQFVTIKNHRKSLKADKQD